MKRSIIKGKIHNVKEKHRHDVSKNILYMMDKNKYKKEWKMQHEKIFQFESENEMKFKTDRFKSAGTLDPHYFLQDIYMAKKIIKHNPKVHYDVGSRVDGFVSHLLASNISVNIIDIRPLPIEIEGLSFTQGDATVLKNIHNNSIASLSSLHALEHFGLGRYGDDVDVNGWRKALHRFEEVLDWGGRLYLSVPIGPENKLVFNAHRIFSPLTIVNEFNILKLVEFSYIKSFTVYNIKPEEYNETQDYLCGLFIFEKC